MLEERQRALSRRSHNKKIPESRIPGKAYLPFPLKHEKGTRSQAEKVAQQSNSRQREWEEEWTCS